MKTYPPTPSEEHPAQRTRSIADSIAEFVAGHETTSVLCLLGLYSATALTAARIRPLWFDELGTWLVASQPSLRQMLIAEPPDGQPPLYYLLARVSMRLFGQNAFALRLPALIAFLVAVCCVYVFTRRRTAPIYGILAAATLCASSAAWYSMEARPYTLLLAGTSAALVCWQSAVSAADSILGKRLPALLGLSLGIAVVILSHAYGFFYVGIPLALGESVRLIQRRRPDLAIYAACLAGFCALAITAPMAHRSHAALFSQGVRTIPLAAPTLARFLADAASLMRTPPICLVSLLALLNLGAARRPEHDADSGQEAGAENASPEEAGAFKPLKKPTLSRALAPDRRTPRPIPPSPIPLYEIASVSGLASLMAASWLLSRLVTHYYFARYGIGTALGLSILSAWLVWRLPFRRVLAAALIVVTIWSWLPPLLPAMFGPKPRFGCSDLMNQADSLLPVVIASPLRFLPAWFYAGPALRQRLHFIADSHQRETLADPIPEVTLAAHADRHSLPMPLDDLDTFLGANPAFLLCSSRESAPSEWLPAELRRRRYRFAALATQAQEPPGTLFLVTRP